MKKLYIIVLNFNGGKDVIECLESLEKSQKLKGWETDILVVDNKSSDGSVQAIKERFRDIGIIENKKNLGFAAGNNVGIKYALKREADAVLLLNQDTVVGEKFLDPLVQNSADIVGPVIKFKRDKRWIYDYGGRINWLLGRATHQESPRYLNNIYYCSKEYVSGCGMLVKKKVFEKIGLLDERFFLYFEDVDFCLRANKAGFTIGVEKNSTILHKLAEGKKKPFFQRWQMIRSNFLFINKDLKFWQRPLAYFYLLILAFKLLL
jgi:GT2 family glycosyltransferase